MSLRGDVSGPSQAVPPSVTVMRSLFPSEAVSASEDSTKRKNHILTGHLQLNFHLKGFTLNQTDPHASISDRSVFEVRLKPRERKRRTRKDILCHFDQVDINMINGYLWKTDGVIKNYYGPDLLTS